MLEGKRVVAIRDRASRGGSIKAIALAIDVSRNTVRRYLRQPVKAGEQTRPGARRLLDALRDEARRLFCSTTHSNAAAVHRLLITCGIDVSVRTVRRVVADLRTRRADAPHAPRVASQGEDSAQWELALARQIAQSRRTADRDELESDLTLHLAKLQHRRHDVRDWKAFLITALNRRADNWLRDLRRKGEPLTSLDAPRRVTGEEEVTAFDIVPHSDPAPEDLLAFKRVRADLNTHLRRVWDALIHERFSQTRAAKRLGLHRNTIGKALRRIRRVLKRHGF